VGVTGVHAAGFLVRGKGGGSRVPGLGLLEGMRTKEGYLDRGWGTGGKLIYGVDGLISAVRSIEINGLDLEV